jgi:type VI secretion system protein ImpL
MAAWQMSQLKFAFGLTGMFTFYGMVSMTVWLIGDRFGYNMTYRVVIIAFVLLTLPIALITGFVISRRNKKKEKAAEEAKEAAGEKPADDQKAQKAAAPTGNYNDLTASTEEVVQFLKTSNLSGNGKEAVYSLPWYLVAGTPKSGKSSLVIGSNLNFQNLPSQRQSEQKFVRTTQNVDWRVTSDAVFVDTAGKSSNF